MAHEHSHASPLPAHLHRIVPGFGPDRAPHYDAQAAVAIAGGNALHELSACTLVSQLEGQCIQKDASAVISAI